MREIVFVTGEVSGDTNAAAVARELIARDAPFKLVGVGGDQMREAGVELIKHVSKLAVMGFVGILQQLPRHWTLLNDLSDRLRSGRVALVVLVDYGGFNLHVAQAAKAAGVPVLYYITPQVWASRPGRMESMASTVTRAAVIFRFEEALLRKNGIDAAFVGHPLADRTAALPSRSEARASLGVSEGARLLAVFPGSRRQEIARHLAPFVETAKRLQAADPSLEVIVSGASNLEIDPAICPYRVVRSSALSILRAADAALCKSGTTTLEAAAAGCPFIIGYATGTVDYAIARQFITVKHIGMVNLIAGREIVPEFVQDDLDPARMAAALTELLDPSSARRAKMLEDLAEVRTELGEPGASGRVASIVLEMATGAGQS